MNVCLYVIELLLNCWTDFDEILNESLNSFDSQLVTVGPTRRVAQTGILRFMKEIFVNKWLLLGIGEIISRN